MDNIEDIGKFLSDNLFDNLNNIVNFIDENKPHTIKRVYRVKKRKIYKTLYAHNVFAESLVYPTYFAVKSLRNIKSKI